MTWEQAISQFIRDAKTFGRFTSENTARSYRQALLKHAEDSQGRGPSETTREDVKRTLARYDNPRTLAHRQTILIVFYDWTIMEDIRAGANPARKVQRARLRQKNSVYRLTRAECTDLMDACADVREMRLVHLGLLAGGRVSELSELRVRHFQRPGFVLFSEDIAKGGNARWVPVLPELQPVIADILAGGEPERFVLRQARDFGPTTPISRYSLNRIVREVSIRAGIIGEVTVHTLRHGFGDHIARYAGLRVAQALLGHSSVLTTASVYTSAVGLDELAGAVGQFTYRGGATPAPQAVNDAVFAGGV